MLSQANQLIVTVAPSVWNRLMFWAHNQKGLEVSGMGVVPARSLASGRIEVHDIVMLAQENTEAYTEMDDTAMSAYYNKCFDEGREIGEFGCVWLHTHPGDSCQPSGTDEETFAKTFKRHPWALMLILGQSGDMYGRIRTGFPAIQAEVNVVVDWTAWEPILSPQEWAKQYEANVRTKPEPIIGTINKDSPVEHPQSIATKSWVDYATFDECKKGLGSKRQYCDWLKAAAKTYGSGTRIKQLRELRALAVRRMDRGTLYESEVRYLLWLNWWLKKEDIKPFYPDNWPLFVQQEGIVVEYGPNCPSLRHVVVDEPVAFGDGLNSDDPPSRQDITRDVGKPCYWGTVLSAKEHGYKVISGGETFYEYNEKLYHPRTNRVMSESEARDILSAADRTETPTALELSP